jgi:hypothetical protein
VLHVQNAQESLKNARIEHGGAVADLHVLEQEEKKKHEEEQKCEDDNIVERVVELVQQRAASTGVTEKLKKFLAEMESDPYMDVEEEEERRVPAAATPVRSTQGGAAEEFGIGTPEGSPKRKVAAAQEGRYEEDAEAEEEGGSIRSSSTENLTGFRESKASRKKRKTVERKTNKKEDQREKEERVKELLTKKGKGKGSKDQEKEKKKTRSRSREDRGRKGRA